MSALTVFIVVAGYFAVLMLVARLTSGKGDSKAFFQANKQAPWYLVAFGMIGATLSGVTFISVPGEVGNTAFYYLQFVLGNLVGYWIIAFVLLPIYYGMGLVSIYSFLGERIGPRAHKAGSVLFLVSRVVGASFRLFLVAGVLQIAFFDQFNIPFAVTVAVSIGLIWLYTFKGGIKTIVWTDTLQTTFILLAVGFSIYEISSQLDWNASEVFAGIIDHPNSKIFNWDFKSASFFGKQFIAGIFMTIVMNGLDQDVMQKNLTCKNRKEAQKNMLWFSVVFALSVTFFLGLGVLLYKFAEVQNIVIPELSDDLFPLIAMNHLSLTAGILFLIGIVAAAYSSADSALTSLTTSYCVDIAHIEKFEAKKQNSYRKKVHLAFSLILLVVVLIFREINDNSVVVALFKFAGYTYGPLLGLFAFSLFMKRACNDRFVPAICILAPILTYVITAVVETIFADFKFGFEVLILNGVITWLGLLLFSKKNA
ncbi:sodium:solute symporter [Puteibacter caeruleilacunae]|nr:sodium:solute symporter [Puteibacter caeruleilacunae]